jgi:hypothetical protein
MNSKVIHDRNLRSKSPTPANVPVMLPQRYQQSQKKSFQIEPYKAI